MLTRARICLSIACLGLTLWGPLVPTTAAQDRRQFMEALTSSPFAAPAGNDHTFVINDGAGLDTGCTYRSGGPLSITLPIRRVLGDLVKLKQDGLIASTIRLEFPAYDVDSGGGSSSTPPERDAVTFNGHSLGFMTGLDSTWVMQRFDINIDWVTFATDPGEDKTSVAASNNVRIDIDTLSGTTENWCTAVDWIAITIDNPVPPRPWVGVHGIFSSNAIWDPLWVPEIQKHGIPATHGPNLGDLDSIQSNSTKVGVAVQAALSRWGVDRVNVVAHSKGGLDTRHYAETNDKVENLVQLGTPNQGSPLADAIEAGTIAALGLSGSFQANRLAGGVGGYQLTTTYMKRYNSAHGANPHTSYLAIAGNYTPGTLLNDTWRRAVTDLIVGPGDVIVPIASVHALPYTTNAVVSSTYPDRSAEHIAMHGNLNFLAPAQGRILRAGSALVAAPVSGLPEEEALAAAPDLQRSPSRSARVNPGQTQDQTLAIDQSASVAFTLFASSGDLQFTLTNPAGTTIQPTSAGVSFEKSELPGGWVLTYSFASPPTGQWVAHLQNTGSAAVDYSLNAWLTGASVVMTASATPAALSLNNPFTIRATLTRTGAALIGATGQAFVRQPNGTVTTVTLLDNGVSPDTTANDGVYSGNVSATSQAGTYEVVVQTTSVPLAPQPFGREAYVQVTVSASTSKLLPGISDFGRDTNGNGRFEELVVRVPVLISSSRTYRWSGTLRDSAGNELRASNSGALTTSTGSVDLSFDGRTILARALNGPYTLTEFSLAEEVNNDILPLAALASSYQTTAYKFSSFEGPNIVLSGAGDAQGVDTNANGRFETLRVTLGITVKTAGSYSWSARLRDLTGAEIALAAGQGTLASGASNIVLDFDGLTIGQFGADGPYDVTDLLVLGPDGTLSTASALRTAAFTGSQFEGYLAPVAVPTFSPAAGSFANTVQVTLATTTAGARIRYTTDGSDPVATSTLYSAALTFTSTVTLKARGFATGLKDSALAAGTFTVIPAAMKIGRPALRFGATKAGAAAALGSVTPAQLVTVAFTGMASGWTVAAAQPWLQVSPASGTGDGAFLVTVADPGNVLGGAASATSTITVTPSVAGIPAKTLPVTLSINASGAIPFGVFDTPVGDATVLAGSVAVTGWTLDDIGVQRVEIWRDLQPGETTPPFASTPSDPRNGKVFISNATFVDGARPDVEALNANTPFAYRAGWGYLLLTWGLWNQGNGTYTLRAFAFDQDSHVSTIGSKTIVVSNNTATKPFGSIDTPGIGGDASGPNFGWGLTPKVNGVATCKIPASGVQVSIDSGPLQPVVYGDHRTDIAGAFTGFSNTDAAGGHYIFDWSTLANGVHTIGWLITDDCNRADGVGSRFFNVTTGTNLVASETGAVSAIAAPLLAASGFRPNEPESDQAITVARGYGELPEILIPGQAGSRNIEVKQGERIEIRVPLGFETAYQLGPDGQRRALPTGASWDAATGTFAWQPAPGFLGRFRLVFSNGRERITIRLVVTR
jgi:Chitobiase/beta-hexosaminidase C-terminal domain